MSGGLLQIATSRTPWRRTRISVVDGGGCDSAAVEETTERFDTIFGIGGVGEVPGGPQPLGNGAEPWPDSLLYVGCINGLAPHLSVPTKHLHALTSVSS